MAFLSWRTWATNQVVTAAELNQDIRDNLNAAFPDEMSGNVWTPTLDSSGTAPTVVSVNGVEFQMGALGFVWVMFTDFSDPGTGTYRVDLPSASSGVTTGGFGQVIGSWNAFDDSSPSNSNHGQVYLFDSDTVRFRRQTGTGHVEASFPFTWAANDRLTFWAFYPLA